MNFSPVSGYVIPSYMLKLQNKIMYLICHLESIRKGCTNFSISSFETFLFPNSQFRLGPFHNCYKWVLHFWTNLLQYQNKSLVTTSQTSMEHTFLPSKAITVWLHYTIKSSDIILSLSTWAKPALASSSLIQHTHFPGLCVHACVIKINFSSIRKSKHDPHREVQW
jgi:hypothetical protein